MVGGPLAASAALLCVTFLIFWLLSALGSHRSTLYYYTDSLQTEAPAPFPASAGMARILPNKLDVSLAAASPPPASQLSGSLAAASPPPAIKLDGSLAAALDLALAGRRPEQHRHVVMLSFGNAAIKGHLLNFVHHANRTSAAYVIGAVDEAAFELLSRHGRPVYKTPLALRRYQLDGANSHSSSSWKEFASMRTGEVMRLVHLGHDVLHTDLDVVWLRDPTPYITCSRAAQEEFGDHSRFPCAPLQKVADAVSSDETPSSR